MRRAVSRQVNVCARAKPSRRSSARRSTESPTSSRASLMSSSSYGSMSRAAEPATYGPAQVLDTMAGQPVAMASRIGRPKLSQSFASTKKVAA